MNMQTIAGFGSAVRGDERTSAVAIHVRAELGFALEERRSSIEAKRMVIEMLRREFAGSFVIDFDITETIHFSEWTLVVDFPGSSKQTITALH